jgi:hypothetical protein
MEGKVYRRPATGTIPIVARYPKTLIDKPADGWSGGVRRRNVRAYPDLPDNFRSGKNTRRNLKDFCRGKATTPHVFEVQVLQVWRDSEQMVMACQNCGKHQGYRFRVWTKPKPDWYRRLQRNIDWL